ncbi:hypothetical protein [Kurthia sibirica]|uniref:DUF4467 domain-containing protein n=1 Tax=Kurthia sibirica TaxID=202750 RepID=A0A2U3AI08_9BACL|nr:hypothetical protein [Kurthia sibirica]PWI24124.1 hypothetical protein DEX24_15125 [Kurthia sibirica]GEK35299.1 hypothetical protein KSI01_28320 [Kurthia sibirica]
MKRIAMSFFVVLLIALLGACNKQLPNSVQLGSVDSHGKIDVTRTLSDDQIFARSSELIADARNIKLADHRTDHLSAMYIQFTNEKQNVVKSNYYLWDDKQNARYICKPYFDADNLYYEITEQEYRILKRQLSAVSTSNEAIVKDKKAKKPMKQHDYSGS